MTYEGDVEFDDEILSTEDTADFDAFEDFDQEGDDFGSDIITLMDDDGHEHSFEVLDSAEFEEYSYMALVPVPDKPEDVLDDTGDFIILRMVEDGGDEYLESIDDDDESQRVYEFFKERLSDVFEFED